MLFYEGILRVRVRNLYYFLIGLSIYQLAVCSGLSTTKSDL